ncbi:tRNA-splicing endonuclease subunit Sen34 [Cyanidiococcus yangmingshanensis]|uniref:tRNA-intron lyase n=1 Tax=Cyanidiococcus yangmingshanensis TaxID=2690220 RepID=A0A7J7IEP8_9RHOD|nr:tRNA-splicing endonuclease subunit Sen34 [Cyanidiococcus yangmingshanensis]
MCSEGMTLGAPEKNTTSWTQSDPIRVVANGPNAYFVWSIEDAERLRCVFRIVGEWVGCAPNHVGQNQFLALPLALNALEVALGVSEGFMVLEWAPWTSYATASAALRHRFETERETCRQEQLAAEAKLAEQRRLQFMAEEEWRIAQQRQHARRLARKRCRPEDEGVEQGPSSWPAADTVQSVSLQPCLNQPVTESNHEIAQDRPRPWKRPRRLYGSWAIQMVAQYILRTAPRRWFEMFQQRMSAPRLIWRRSMQALGAVFQLNQHHRAYAEHSTNPDSRRLVETRSAEGQTPGKRPEQARSRPYRIRIHIGRAPFEELDTEHRTVTMLDKSNLEEDAFWRQMMRSPRFLVFRDLWRRGFYLTIGHKFGADFLAYAHDPCLFHAGLCVTVMDKYDRLHPRDMISAGRLGVATKKRATLACVENTEQGLISYRGIAWCESLP